MTILEILEKSKVNEASDIHLNANTVPIARIKGKLMALSKYILTEDNTKDFATSIMSKEDFKTLEAIGEVDFAYTHKEMGRFRVNAYMQKKSIALVFRVINNNIPSMKDLELPPIIEKLCNKTRGLILVTGPTGSGKSTTLASIINEINLNRNEHIITIEDPIEYIHGNKKSILSQREVGTDTKNFENALKSSLREDPDIILVGEMRDLETIGTVITAVETGHLVLSTLHTTGAIKTVDRIIDAFPPHQQEQVRGQLSSTLEAVISQQLIPKKNGLGRVAVFEIMIATNPIKNLIREGKTFQIPSIMQTSKDTGMITMDSSLISLYKDDIISKENLIKYCIDYNYVIKEVL